MESECFVYFVCHLDIYKEHEFAFKYKEDDLYLL